MILPQVGRGAVVPSRGKSVCVVLHPNGNV